MVNTNMARIKNFLTPQWLKEFEEMKRQAASSKRQASSHKRKRQASSNKRKPEPSSGSQES
jgi:phage regulator Rha-like protein